jgi:hypothetical protein
MSEPCTCPDPYCPEHARCVSGHKLIILDDDPAFCPTCGHDVMPVGACRHVNPAPGVRTAVDRALARRLGEHSSNQDMGEL